MLHHQVSSNPHHSKVCVESGVNKQTDIEGQKQDGSMFMCAERTIPDTESLFI